MNKKDRIPIQFSSAKVDRFERTAYHMHEIQAYHLGFGYVGKSVKKRVGSKTHNPFSRPIIELPPEKRTMLRVRSAAGICTYIYRTSPGKGKAIPACRHFTVVKQITREQAVNMFGEEKIKQTEQ